jgi:protein phosphatase
MDHSLGQEAVREGILTPEQARVHPQRNIITRALGTQDDIEVDTLTLTTRPGDLFVVASDGLTGLLEDFEMEDIIHQTRGVVDKTIDALVEGALEQGGNDNITVVVVRVPGGDPLDASTPGGELPESLLETTLP